jgi:ABC-type phosphate transport system substrate-binding protein
MKAMFGVVSLLVALAIVGLVAVKQLKAVGQTGASAAAQAGLPATPSLAGSGTVREQAQQLQNKVANDAINAMQQGATARKEESEKQ